MKLFALDWELQVSTVSVRDKETIGSLRQQIAERMSVKAECMILYRRDRELRLTGTVRQTFLQHKETVRADFHQTVTKGVAQILVGDNIKLVEFGCEEVSADLKKRIIDASSIRDLDITVKQSDIELCDQVQLKDQIIDKTIDVNIRPTAECESESTDTESSNSSSSSGDSDDDAEQKIASTANEDKVSDATDDKIAVNNETLKVEDSGESSSSEGEPSPSSEEVKNTVVAKSEVSGEDACTRVPGSRSEMSSHCSSL